MLMPGNLGGRILVVIVVVVTVLLIQLTHAAITVSITQTPHADSARLIASTSLTLAAISVHRALDTHGQTLIAAQFPRTRLTDAASVHTLARDRVTHLSGGAVLPLDTCLAEHGGGLTGESARVERRGGWSGVRCLRGGQAASVARNRHTGVTRNLKQPDIQRLAGKDTSTRKTAPCNGPRARPPPRATAWTPSPHRLPSARSRASLRAKPFG
jgi:hypothetical protein